MNGVGRDPAHVPGAATLLCPSPIGAIPADPALSSHAIWRATVDHLDRVAPWGPATRADLGTPEPGLDLGAMLRMARGLDGPPPPSTAPDAGGDFDPGRAPGAPLSPTPFTGGAGDLLNHHGAFEYGEVRFSIPIAWIYSYLNTRRWHSREVVSHLWPELQGKIRGTNWSTFESPDAELSIVRAGEWLSCGLRPDGSISCWGVTELVPELSLTTEWVDVDTSLRTVCGLDATGRVACWGGSAGEPFVPPDYAFQSISVGTYMACGVKIGDRVECWDADPGSPVRWPPSDTEAKSVDVGKFDACLITLDDTLECWGEEDWKGEIPTPAGTFEQVSVSDDTGLMCGVRTDGHIECWGMDAPAIHPP